MMTRYSSLLTGVLVVAIVIAGGCQAILGLDEGTKREDGNTKGCDPAACPAPETKCHTAICDAQNQCGFGDAPERTPCNESGGNLCDGQGTCVECIDGADCMADDVCNAGVCQPLTCTDGIQNGTETDVDCGGPDCTFCPVILLLGGGGSTIAAGEYTPASGWTVLSLTGVTSDRPSVAISTKGEGVGLIHFTGVGAGIDELRAAPWQSDSGWGPFAALGVLTRTTPAISAGGTDFELVYQASNLKHFYMALIDGSWTASETIGLGSNQSLGPSEADLTVRGADATMAYVNGDGGLNHLFCRRRIAGGWGVGEDIAPDPELTIAPEIVVLPESQDLLVVFVRTVDHQILSLRWNGVAWEFPTPIANAFTDGRPTLTSLVGDQAALAFQGTDGMLYTSRYNGSQWSSPAGVANPNVQIAGPPAIAHGIRDAEIELVYVSPQNTVFHTRYRNGAWTMPINVVMTAGLNRVAIASAP